MNVEKSRRGFLSRAAGAMVLLLAGSTAMAQNGILYEDYRGTTSTGNTGLPPAPYFDNLSRQVNNDGGNLPRLMALEGQAGAVQRRGAVSNFGWTGANPVLCDSSDIGRYSASARAACNGWVMGRIGYTIIRFPVAGELQLRVAHDDDLKVDLSDDIHIGSNYRNANWNFHVGQLSTYVPETTWVPLGRYNSPAAGSCALMRFAWANNGGLNFLHLRYRTSNFNGSNTNATGNLQFADADFISPLDTESIQSKCTGALQAPQVFLKKVIVGGRIDDAHQFNLRVRTGANNIVSSATTSGTEDTMTVPVANMSINGGTVTIEELAVGGATLGDYAPAAVCTKTTANNQTPVPVALTKQSSGQAWDMVAPAAGDKVSCTITNTRPTATLSLTKTSSVAADTVMRTGQTLNYTVVARNTGTGPAAGSVIRDPAVPGIACQGEFTCTPSGGASCPAAGSRSVSSLQGAGITVTTFPAGSSLSLGFTCTVTATGY